MVDLWDPVTRGVAMAGAIGSIFGTPILAPVMGNFIAASYLGWRWDNWLSAIMGLSCSVLVFFLLPESSAIVILKKKAKHVREKDGNPEAHCIYDGQEKGLNTIVHVYLIRPFSEYFVSW